MNDNQSLYLNETKAIGDKIQELKPQDDELYCHDVFSHAMVVINNYPDLDVVS